MRVVIYLITSPLSKRNYNRFGIQRWLDRGWEVKVFDFTKFLKPEFWDYVDGHKLSCEFEGLEIIEDKKSALSSICQLKAGVVFIDLIGSSRFELKIRHATKKKGVRIKLKLGSLPSKQSDGSIFFNIVQNALKNPVGFFPKVTNKIRQLRENGPNYFVVGGNAPLQNTSKGNPSIIKAHSYDYDFFYTKKKELESNNNGLVFLDTDEAYHSDFVHLGIKPFVTAEKYFPLMNVSLSQIAESFGYDVRIAAHPRSDYDNKSFSYSFSILKDQTFELIKQSRVVVSHGSTSLQWAIIMRKPIILVTTDEMKKSTFNHTTEGFALALGKEVVNLNRIPKNFNWKSQLLIDETKYYNYIETYVKESGTPEKPLWKIVIDRIETDLFNSKIQSF
jgi:hypothetical protein